MRVFLVDDEEQAQITMKYYLQEFFPDINVIGVAADVISAGKEITRLKPDLVFLDITMPDGTGFDLLERMSKNAPLFVFVSAHRDFAFEAIRVNIFDYLLKPIQIKELTRVITKARQHLELHAETPLENGKIQIKADGKILLLSKEDINYVSSEGNYSTIHLANGKHIVISKNLKKLEESLFTYPPFFRTHQSFIVNLQKVLEYDSDEITIQSSVRIPISKARLDLLKEALNRI